MFQVKVDAKELKDVQQRLRVAGRKDLAAELAKGMRKALRPAVPAARAAIRRSAASSGPSTGLRRRLARTVTAKVRISRRLVLASVYMDQKKMPSGQRGLPAAWEGKKRWRHPVYGDRDVWVTQRSHPSFEREMRKQVPRVQREAAAAIKNVLRKL